MSRLIASYNGIKTVMCLRYSSSELQEIKQRFHIILLPHMHSIWHKILECIKQYSGVLNCNQVDMMKYYYEDKMEMNNELIVKSHLNNQCFRCQLYNQYTQVCMYCTLCSLIANKQHIYELWVNNIWSQAQCQYFKIGY